MLALRTDFLVVTALPDERDAVLAQLGAHTVVPQSDNDPCIYYQAVIKNTRHQQPFVVTATCLTSMGRVQAATTTSAAIRRWQPEYVVLVGIAGGVAKAGVKLGDVLFSSKIVDYELQKVVRGKSELRPSYPPISNRLIAAAQALDDEWLRLVKTPRPLRGEPEVHTGTIATGDKVVNEPKFLAKLVDLDPKLIGVEMESGGAAVAAQHAETNFFMVRGTSDLADGHKNRGDVKRWRRYACDAAAAFVVHLIRTGPLAAPSPTVERVDYGDIARAVRSVGSAVEQFDTMARQVTAFVSHGKVGAPSDAYRFHYEGHGIELTAKRGDQIVQVIGGNELRQRLDPTQLRHVQTLERAMEANYRIWAEVYPKLPLISDPIDKARLVQRLDEVLDAMSADLDTILQFLQACGLFLDDHYVHIRSLLAQRRARS